MDPADQDHVDAVEPRAQATGVVGPGDDVAGPFGPGIEIQPPQHQDPQRAEAGQVMQQVLRNLRNGKHIDQLKEQFGRTDLGLPPVLVAQVGSGAIAG